MQRANIMLAIGGDTGSLVPKYNVTAAEIAVLQAIHGNDAVTDIKPTDNIRIADRVERTRLLELYGRAHDGEGRSHVENLYPGAAARLFQKVEELDIDESQLHPSVRETLGQKIAEAAGGQTADDEAAFDPAPEEEDEEEDGVGGEIGDEFSEPEAEAGEGEAGEGEGEAGEGEGEAGEGEGEAGEAAQQPGVLD